MKKEEERLHALEREREAVLRNLRERREKLAEAVDELAGLLLGVKEELRSVLHGEFDQLKGSIPFAPEEPGAMKMVLLPVAVAEYRGEGARVAVFVPMALEKKRGIVTKKAELRTLYSSYEDLRRMLLEALTEGPLAAKYEDALRKSTDILKSGDSRAVARDGLEDLKALGAISNDKLREVAQLLS